METKINLPLWCDICIGFCSHQISFTNQIKDEVTYNKQCDKCQHESIVKVPQQTWESIKNDVSQNLN